MFDNDSDEDSENQIHSDKTNKTKTARKTSKKSDDKDDDRGIRLNKLISESGICSRRQADKIIEEGRVIVNGKKVFELGIRVDPMADKVVVDGKPLRKAGEKIYVMFHKPKGVLTTMEDPLDRPTIKEFLDRVPFRVFPIGRLDWDTEGLLLLTNDGDYANRVMHPREEVTKTYLVKLNGQPSPGHIEKLLRGVSIVGGKVRAKHVEKIRRPDASDKYDWYKIIISEGKNRQVRQMFEKIGFDVMKLQRVAIGCLRIGALEKGDMVFLNDVAIERVFQPDNPDAVKLKKTYKGKSVSVKKTANAKAGLKQTGAARPMSRRAEARAANRPASKAASPRRSNTRPNRSR